MQEPHSPHVPDTPSPPVSPGPRRLRLILAAGVVLLGIAATAAFFLYRGNSGSVDEYLVSGRAFMAKKEYPAAIIQFKNAVRAEPESGEAHFELAVALRAVTELVGANVELRKAQDLAFDPARLAPEMASLAIDMGKPQEALDIATTAVVGDGAAKNTLRALEGDALFALKRLDDAIKAYDGVLAADPRHPVARLGQARVALFQGKTDEAVSRVEEIVRDTPDHGNAWYLRGTLQRDSGHRSEAIESFTRLLSLAPGDQRAYVALVGALLAANRIEDAEKQIDALRKIVRASPTTALLEAMVAHASRDFPRARTAIQNALKSRPDDFRALLLAADIETSLGNDVAAEKLFEKLIAAFPQAAQPRQMLAAMYVRIGRPDRARTVLEPLMRSGRVDLNTLLVSGDVSLAEGKRDQAIQQFRQAVEGMPASAPARIALGRALIATGKPAEGVAEWVAAVDMAPTRVEVYEPLVRHYLKTGQNPKALALVEALTRHAPDDPSAHVLRGETFLAANDAPAARAEFESALKLSPAHMAAVRNLTFLDLKSRQPEAARKRLEDVLGGNPRQEDAAMLLAVLLRQTKAPDAEVLGVLDNAIRVNATSSRLRLAKIDLLASKGDRNGAIEATQSALGVLPDDPAILHMAARVQQMGGDLDQASKSFAKLPGLMPSSDVPHLGQAQVYVAQHNYPAARDSIQLAINANPKRIETHLALVEVEIRDRRLADARRDAQRVQQIWPVRGEGYIAESDVLRAGKDLPGAEAVLRTGLAKSGSADVLRRLVETLAVMDKVADAEKEATAWLARHPRDVRVMATMGDVRTARKEFADAARWYRKALTVVPRSPTILNNLAWALGQTRDPEAIRIGQQALENAPGDPLVLDTLAYIHSTQGQTEQAVDLYRKAVDGLPQSPLLRVSLAKALFKNRQLTEAKAELEAAAKLNPSEKLRQEILYLRTTN